MQSKTSSCNIFCKTLFWKNVKRCWPLWAGYAFIVFWLFPGILYFDNSFRLTYDVVTMQKRVNRMILEDFTSTALWLSLIMGIVFAMVLFNYLEGERSCYFMHSLPVTRTNLFFTGFASGFVMMFVPNLFAFIISNCVCSHFGVGGFKNLCLWLLIFMVEELFFFSCGILCITVIGNTVFAAVVYSIMEFFVSIILFPINYLYRSLYYGIDGSLLSIPRENIIGIITPVSFLQGIGIDSIYDDSLEFAVNYKFDQWTPTIVITTFIAAIIVLAVSYILYKVRKSENAGEFVALEFMRPVFRWGVGLSNGLLMTWMIVDTLFSDMTFSNSLPVIVCILILIFSAIGFIGAEMLMRKSVRIFKNCGRELIVFSITVLVLIVGLLAFGKKKAIEVPERNEVNSVYFSISGGGTSFYDDEAIDELLEIQQYIVDNYHNIVDSYHSRNYYSTYIIHIIFYTDKGEISRNYVIPGNEVELRTLIYSFGNKHMVEMVFGDYAPIKTSAGYDFNNVGRNGYYLMEANFTVYGDANNDFYYVTLDEAEAKQLIQAVVRDIEEGNLTISRAFGYYEDSLLPEYNSIITENDTNNLNGGGSYYSSLEYEETGTIEFQFNVSSAYGYEFSNLYYNYRSINFGSECSNIIDFMEHCDKIPEGYLSFNPNMYYKY